MTYINQLSYPELLYPTSLEKNGRIPDPSPSFAKAGCGLSCACMMIENLTGAMLSPESAVDFSVSCGANNNGTDMTVLGKALAEQYELDITISDDIDDLRKCVEAGGNVIFNSGAVNKIFSNGGHFLLATGFEKDDLVKIADPSLTPEKYTDGIRSEKVIVRGDYIFADVETIREECSNRTPAYFCFLKKSLTQSEMNGQEVE